MFSNTWCQLSGWQYGPQQNWKEEYMSKLVAENIVEWLMSKTVALPLTFTSNAISIKLLRNVVWFSKQ